MVVEVHNAHSDPDELWYNTGVLDASNRSITWSSLSDDQRHYSSGGIDPTVSINDYGMVVEIHSTDSNHLYYRTGVLNSSSCVIEWRSTPTEDYDTGRWPSVAINNDNMVIEVHQSPGGTDLWYNVGQVEQNGAITWGNMSNDRKYDSGQYPSVALYGDRILEIHNSESDYMWCTVGRLNASAKTIDWIDWVDDNVEHRTYAYPCEEQGSVFPDVAINEQSAFEVHSSSATNYLWWRPGEASNRVMVWGGSNRLDLAASGTRPSAAMTDQDVLLFYSADYQLFYRVGTLYQ
jgi:hypothetical protein